VHKHSKDFSDNRLAFSSRWAFLNLQIPVRTNRFRNTVKCPSWSLVFDVSGLRVQFG